MTINLDFGHIIALVIAFAGLYTGLGKILINQVEKRLDDRFESINKNMSNSDQTLQKQSLEWARLDRDLMAIRVELAERYAKIADLAQIREDINSGFTRLYDKLDNKVSKSECETLRGNGKGQ